MARPGSPTVNSGANDFGMPLLPSAPLRWENRAAFARGFQCSESGRYGKYPLVNRSTKRLLSPRAGGAAFVAPRFNVGKASDTTAASPVGTMQSQVCAVPTGLRSMILCFDFVLPSPRQGAGLATIAPPARVCRVVLVRALPGLKSETRGHPTICTLGMGPADWLAHGREGVERQEL